MSRTSGIRQYSRSVTPFCRCLHFVPAHCMGRPKPLCFCIRKKCGLLTGLCLHNCFIDIVSNQPVSLAWIETSGDFHPLDKYPRFPLLLFREICILRTILMTEGNNLFRASRPLDYIPNSKDSFTKLDNDSESIF